MVRHTDEAQFDGIPQGYAGTLDKRHGGIEVHRCWAISDPLAFQYIRNYAGWSHLRTRLSASNSSDDCLTRPKSTWLTNISSLETDAEQLLQATRFYWAVENSVHWALMSSPAKMKRARVGHASNNMAILRQLALSIFKQIKSKDSICVKRCKAGLDVSFLETLLDQI